MRGLDKRSMRQLQSAIKAHQAGQLQIARDQYRGVLAKRPHDPDALHFLGVLEHNQGRSEVGIASIQRSLEVAPHNAQAWLNLGNILLELDRGNEAKAAYERASTLVPDCADAWYNLGICLRKLDDAPAAVRALEPALKLRPAHAPSWYQRGIANRDAGELNAAEADFRRAIELRVDYTEVYESLGMLLYRQDRIAAAGCVYAAWAKQDPTSSTAAHMAAAMSGEAVPIRGSDSYVTETFDRFAATFDQNLANLGYRAPELVANALMEAVGESVVLGEVLDAGCGTGLCGAFLRPFARRLVGVDLSSGMVDLARAKGHYDDLQVAELCDFMRRCPRGFDAVVSADTFVYFGGLEEGFAAAAKCLKPAGVLVLTLEQMGNAARDQRDYRLEPHGRYSHRDTYVSAVLEGAGFRVERTAEQVLRRERGSDVRGMVISAKLGQPTLD